MTLVTEAPALTTAVEVGYFAHWFCSTIAYAMVLGGIGLQIVHQLPKLRGQRPGAVAWRVTRGALPSLFTAALVYAAGTIIRWASTAPADAAFEWRSALALIAPLAAGVAGTFALLFVAAVVVQGGARLMARVEPAGRA